MSKSVSYPLEELIQIKQNRFDRAVKVLEEKKALLEKAYELLFDLKEDRDKMLDHKREKIKQLREELDSGTTTDKIEQMKYYLKSVDERLLEKEKKVVAQQKQVDLAQQQVDVATDDLFQKKKDLEKLEIHKKEWSKEARYGQQQKEAVEHDEQGSATYHLKKKEAQSRKKNTKGSL